MEESNNQLERNQLTEDENIILEEVNTDPSLARVKAPKGMRDTVMRRIDEQQHPAIYAGLSDEDKDALYLGRELIALRKEGAKAKAPGTCPHTAGASKRKRFKKRTAKAYGLVAAAAVAVMAIGITTVGGPQHIAEMVDSMFGGRSEISINSQKDDITEEESDERKAYQRVSDELGFEPARLYYKPTGMEFESSEVDSDLQVATLLYSYNSKIVKYKIVANYRNRSLKFDSEDKLINKYVITVEGVEVLIKQFQIEESGETKYSAQYVYKDVNYLLSGVIDKENFEEIIKNINFI